jgi:hypothetical protein
MLMMGDGHLNEHACLDRIVPRDSIGRVDGVVCYIIHDIFREEELSGTVIIIC